MSKNSTKSSKVKVELILESAKDIAYEGSSQRVFLSWKISRAASGETKKVPVTKDGLASFNKRITFKTKFRGASATNSITLTLRSKVGRITHTLGRLVFDLSMSLSPKWTILHFPFDGGDDDAHPIYFEGRMRIKDDDNSSVHFEDSSTMPAARDTSEMAASESNAVDLSMDDESFILSHDDVKRPQPDVAGFLRERVQGSIGGDANSRQGEQMMRREVDKLRKGEWERQQKMMRAQIMELENQNRELGLALDRAGTSANSLSLQTLNERIEEMQNEAQERNKLVETLRTQVDSLEEQATADANRIQDLSQANAELTARLDESLSGEQELHQLLKEANSSRPALTAVPSESAASEASSAAVSVADRSPVKKPSVKLPAAKKADLAVHVITFVLLLCAIAYTVYKKFR